MPRSKCAIDDRLRQEPVACTPVKLRDIVIQTEHLSAESSAWLSERCRLVICPFEDPGFADALADAAGLVVRTYTQVNQALLDLGPKLRVIGRAGTGLDNVDVPACQRRGVEVVYTPDANTQAVVEYVLCLICDVLRPRPPLDRVVAGRIWNHMREKTVGRRQMNELTLGILGLGRVGKRLARAATGIGFKVIYNDLLDIPANLRHGATPVSVEELFFTSDIVSIHIDGRPRNMNFVDSRLIERMKEEAIFINTSRGFVVDNLPLARFLKNNPGALAMLDVHEPEPFGEDYPFLGLPNARLYPHLASRTETAMNNMSWVVRDVAAVLEGRKPEFPAPMSE
jgi:phosphoglycerate dehydrogenase-like enzyme